MTDLVYKDESYAIMGACFDVYKEMGAGFAEAVYQECLEIELHHRSIPFVAQPVISISYKNRKLAHPYIADLTCYGKVLLELKAVSALTDGHRSQLHNYLKATKLHLGLLINFGGLPQLQYERVVMTRAKSSHSTTEADRTNVR